ncbi:MAG TPA: hypothetical protein VE010_09755 [Thermoanaerobaculia bacterium]|nr:hypothetical protein [Thermoanaerobaculia bacterium]
MTRRLLSLAFLFVVACGGEQDPKSAQMLSRTPCSVRGWILDVKGAQQAENADLEIARRTELFTTSSVWVEDTEFASGGIAENGAFIILDVPPQKATLGFQATGAADARLVLEGVPPSADVLIPNVILENNGATILDPKLLQVRIPDRDVDKPTPNGQTARIAGHAVPIMRTPLHMLEDRRDYPNPGGFRPVATFK